MEEQIPSLKQAVILKPKNNNLTNTRILSLFVDRVLRDKDERASVTKCLTTTSVFFFIF